MLSYEEVLDMFDRRNMDTYNSKGKVQGFAEALEVDLEVGLTDEEKATGFSKRIAKYGQNILPDPPSDSWCSIFIGCFKDLMLIILLCAAILSLILEGAISYDKEKNNWEVFIEPISIFLAVLIVATVQTQVEYSQQKTFLEINKLKNSYDVTVIRNGHEEQILSTEVLMGDILSLKSGNAIAADCLYIRGQDLKVNNSAQTGESDAIAVHEQAPFMYGGTAVETGFGHALVVAIGPHTRSGDMMMKIQSLESEKKDEKSPLEAKLERVAILLTYIGAAGGILTFIVLFIFWLIDLLKTVKDQRRSKIPQLVDKLMVAITIFICAVPEGLPLAVTIALGFSMKRMMKDQNFVRHLSACETMGGATAICSDKTGTLTQNKMTVVRFYQIGSEAQKGTNPTIDNKDILELFSKAVAINSTAYKTTTTETKKIGKTVETITKEQFVGSSSECALLQLLEPWGKNYEQIRKDANILHVHEFSSARKKMSTIVKEGDIVKAYMKGGPDFCLGLCTHYISNIGERLEITEEVKNDILKQVTVFANDSLRTMLVAYRDLGAEFKEEYKDASTVEHDLTVLAIVGIQDPLREEVKDAVAACRTAGVVVRMVTGDFIATAKAIARECGILDESKGETAMEGQEFARLDKIEMLDKVPSLRVMARSSPMDKLKLVSFLMEAGEVVAVTGDGSNDSPALKQADVGLSMGRCGTELAKMASDIVILDDNFNSIVTALKWGRCVYDNVKGFLQFQLTVNFAAMIVAFIGSVKFKESPLTTVQLLWVNLIMDSLGALALATRGPTNSLIKRQPYGRSDHLLSPILLRNIIGHTIYQIIVLLLIIFGHQKIFKLGFDDEKAIDEKNGRKILDQQISGIVFNTFVYMQVFNLPNARIAGTDTPFFEGLFTNIFFIVIFLVIFIVQAVLIEFAGKAFYHKWNNNLSDKDGLRNWGIRWAISLGFGVGSLVIGAILRMINLRDHTTDRLNAHRAQRAVQIREVYSTMSKEEQFKCHIAPSGKLIRDGEPDDDKKDENSQSDSGSGVSLSVHNNPDDKAEALL